MANPKKIDFGNTNSGIQVEYIKSRKTLSFFGWYDHYVGIEPHSMTLKEFCEKLGIEAKDIK